MKGREGTHQQIDLSENFKSVMPPKKHTIADACRVMKRCGISGAKTKAALKELLKLYENNWELIVDDDYRVLLDVILDKNSKEEVHITYVLISGNAYWFPLYMRLYFVFSFLILFCLLTMAFFKQRVESKEKETLIHESKVTFLFSAFLYRFYSLSTLQRSMGYIAFSNFI